jgi:hypothetical protein
MSRQSSIVCDVCGKRGSERISDWFEIDAGPDGFFAVSQAGRPAGIGRSSKDICGSRCLCVALERWVDRHLRLARDPGAPEEGEAQEWTVPFPQAPESPLLLEGPQLVPVKVPKSTPAVEALPEGKKRRGLFRREITR